MVTQQLLLTLCGIRFGSLGHKTEQKMASGKCFFDLGADFECEGVKALRQIADALQKMVVEDNRWDGHEEAGGGSDERFGDAGRHGSEAGSAGISESRKGVDDAPDGTEKADERRDGAGCGEPRHAFFDAANFFRGSKLHADGDGLEAFQFACGLRITSAHLAQEFAIARRIDVREGRSGCGERLRIGDAFCGAKDAEELVALTANAAEHAEFLKDHGPGDDGKNPEQDQNAAGNPARLRKNVTEISDEERSGQENDATPQSELNLAYLRNVAHAYRVVKQMRCGG
jgi:hypothetical protein